MTGKVLPDKPQPGWVGPVQSSCCQLLDTPHAESFLHVWISVDLLFPKSLLCTPPPSCNTTCYPGCIVLTANAWSLVLPAFSLVKYSLAWPHFSPYIELGCHWAPGHHCDLDLAFPDNSQPNAFLAFIPKACWKKKKADGKGDSAQARAITERCQGTTEQIHQITLLPDNLFVPFPLSLIHWGWNIGDSDPMVEPKIEWPIQIFPTLWLTIWNLKKKFKHSVLSYS